ncbi:MAG: flgJ [Bacteriovoracaceae bacterium]|nr:flgJ [Bacteriovoracaceae bacterium]
MSDMKLTDLSGMSNLQMPSAKVPTFGAKSKAELQKAANEFEGMFMDIVMKSMRDTVGESDAFGDSKKVKFFQTMLDSEYSKQMGDQGKIGLSAAIVRQLAPHVPPAGLTKKEDTK